MGRLVCCLLLLLVADAKADELFVAHSRDNPSVWWHHGLDATFEETQRDGRVSIFKLHKRRGTEGAAGRFFICTVLSLAKKRGYVNYSIAETIDGRDVVIFLKEHDEDIQAIIDSGYREYEFDERAGAADIAMVEEMCAAAANM